MWLKTVISLSVIFMSRADRRLFVFCVQLSTVRRQPRASRCPQLFSPSAARKCTSLWTLTIVWVHISMGFSGANEVGMAAITNFVVLSEIVLLLLILALLLLPSFMLKENTRRKGKDHCSARLQFNRIGLNCFTTHKYVATYFLL